MINHVSGLHFPTKPLVSSDDSPLKTPSECILTKNSGHQISAKISKTNGAVEKIKNKFLTVKSALSGISKRRDDTWDPSEKALKVTDPQNVRSHSSSNSRRSIDHVRKLELNSVADSQESSKYRTDLPSNVSSKKIKPCSWQNQASNSVSHETNVIEEQKVSSNQFLSRCIYSEKHKYLIKISKDSFWPRSTNNEFCRLSRAQDSSKVHFIFSFRQKRNIVPANVLRFKSNELNSIFLHDSNIEVIDLYSKFSDCKGFFKWNRTIIGTGATADVRCMKEKDSAAGGVFAVKKFHFKKMSLTDQEYFQRVLTEFTIARSVQHPNVVETFSLCSHKGRLFQVMEFCDQGDLFSLVSQKYLARQEFLADRLCLFKQLIQGLNYLHSNGVAHCDLKLENLLVTQKSKLKITDFGISQVSPSTYVGVETPSDRSIKEIVDTSKYADSIPGSRPYIAPEAITNKGEYDARSLDVWAAAIIMLCLTANGILWPEAKSGSSPLYDDLINGWADWEAKHVPIYDIPCCNTATSAQAFSTSLTSQESFARPSEIFSATDYPRVSFLDNYINPPALRRILLSMLDPNPKTRISISRVTKSRWLHNVECCVLDNPSRRTIIDAAKGKCFTDKGDISNFQKIVCHNHLPPQSSLLYSKLCGLKTHNL